MDYYATIQKSIDFIEENLSESISLEQIARHANFSITHFYRVFQAMVGEPVKEYIRKRRLSEAAYTLLATKNKVLDVAIEYRFESQEAFTRAFDKMYGVTPGRYRKNRQELVFYEKVLILERRKLNLFGGIEMEPKIIIKDGFSVIGMECKMSQAEKEAGFNPAVELWQKFHNRKHEIKDGISGIYYGLTPHESWSDAKQSYIAGIQVTQIDAVPKGMVFRTLPSAKYAVFTIKGKIETWGNQFDCIFGKWLPESGFELGEADSIEIYGEKAKDVSSDDYEYDLYLPVK